MDNMAIWYHNLAKQFCLFRHEKLQVVSWAHF